MDFCLCSGKRTESDCKDEPLAPWRVPSLWCVCFCVRVSVSVSCDSQCSLVNLIFISDETTRMPVLTTAWFFVQPLSQATAKQIHAGRCQ